MLLTCYFIKARKGRFPCSLEFSAQNSLRLSNCALQSFQSWLFLSGMMPLKVSMRWVRLTLSHHLTESKVSYPPIIPQLNQRHTVRHSHCSALHEQVLHNHLQNFVRRKQIRTATHPLPRKTQHDHEPRGYIENYQQPTTNLLFVILHSSSDLNISAASDLCTSPHRKVSETEWNQDHDFLKVQHMH